MGRRRRNKLLLKWSPHTPKSSDWRNGLTALALRRWLIDSLTVAWIPLHVAIFIFGVQKGMLLHCWVTERKKEICPGTSLQRRIFIAQQIFNRKNRYRPYPVTVKFAISYRIRELRNDFTGTISNIAGQWIKSRNPGFYPTAQLPAVPDVIFLELHIGI